jgi:hypothetical protein
MTELQILTAVKNNNGTIGFVDLLNLSLTDPHPDPIADEDRIKQMIKDGLLTGEAGAYSQIHISKYGRRFLQDSCYASEEEQKAADKRSQEASDNHRRNLKTTILGALISALAGFLFNALAFYLFC